MFLHDLWYFGGPAEALKPGQMHHRVIAGEPVLIGRAGDGSAFAIRNICPHRGILLTEGRMITGATTPSRVECPYHGWQFGTDGGCLHIPSLVEGQELDPERIRVRSFPLEEQDGNLWIYMAAKDNGSQAPEFATRPPTLPCPVPAKPLLREAMVFNCDVDHAVIGLMDPAHGPFVHRAWWWRSEKSIHPKQKNFGPTALGFAMRDHRPSSNSFLYRLLGGDVRTEISFQIPGIRIEHIKVGKHFILGLTCVTPIDEFKTEVSQTFYTDMSWLRLAKPFLRSFARTFLRQDRDAVEGQQKGLAFGPRLMLIDDADTQAKWYHRLKKEWIDCRAQDRPFSNPVPETVLKWRS